ncbi:zf-TFIIB domain-containing protein [Corallococcus sp. M34]|uniref:zf-TFIIB domain-containing protein n=1 Tax=Citreicoccus inhibens TaxID=2849499 RepID=UPI001C22AACC|nr:zf-TFIIB domain-containing protein [Citreicoccus inhibens]MBU8897388.1 zf-TFIIB domain-containing protein [Citreicoccus inhibens]
MSACPFCQTSMRATTVEGLPHEACEACGAMWLEGESLARVMGDATPGSLVQQAKGRSGRCRGCEAELSYVPGCPSCGRRAPTCPRCETRPLSVVTVRGVAIDVCPRCPGVAMTLDALPRLHAVSAARELEMFDLHPKLKSGARSGCTGCGRKLKAEHGFVWEERLYCGSCAPEGSTPYSDEMTQALPSAEPLHYGKYGGGVGGALSNGRTENALVWLFRKILG